MNTDKIIAESIAKEYAPKTASKITALKKLDRKAKRPAFIFAYCFGIISALILGTGMSFAMCVIGSGTASAIAAGVIIGSVGILGMAVNYPIYKKIRESGKRKYSFEIMELAKEITDEK